MALLGAHKMQLLAQLRRHPNVDLQTLIKLLNQYEDLELEDLRGYISDELYEQLEEVLRDPEKERREQELERVERMRREEEAMFRYSPKPSHEPMPSPEPEPAFEPEPDPCPRPSLPPSEKCCPYPKPSSLDVGTTYVPHSKKSWWQRMTFWRRKDERREVCTSVFAPAEISPGRNMLIQVYLHLADEEKKVISLAQEAQSNAVRKGYDTLSQFLKVGDVVNVALSIYGWQGLLFQDEKSITWKGHFSKCDFRYLVPQDSADDELSCELIFRLRDIPLPIGEMTFVSSISENPRELNAKMSSKTYRHAFVSYAHKDGNEVDLIVKALEAIGVKFFYDKITLSCGDVFDEVIMENIDQSDVFILCWSKNSAESKYVRKEIERALPRAYPQVKPQEVATLKFYPISIEPVDELPDYLKDIYHFASMKMQELISTE